MTPFETMIRAEEGLRLKVYKDNLGNLTAGYGHLIQPEDGLQEGDEITEEQAEEWLYEDLQEAISRSQLKLPWIFLLDENRKSVILCMIYQMGMNGLMKFQHFLEALKAHLWKDASSDMMNSLWASQTPNRAKRLSMVIETGQLPEYYNS